MNSIAASVFSNVQKVEVSDASVQKKSIVSISEDSRSKVWKEIEIKGRLGGDLTNLLKIRELQDKYGILRPPHAMVQDSLGC